MSTGFRLVVVMALCAGLMSALGGCNTMRGVGKDIERGGEKIQNATQ